MKTELISIGSELTSGQNLDTNSQWLSKRLAEVGRLMATEGTTPLIKTPGELKSFMDAETTKWVRLAAEAGIQPE